MGRVHTVLKTPEPCTRCGSCGHPLQAWTRMIPDPSLDPALEQYRLSLGNVLIAHGWLTYDGLVWQHPGEGGERFDDKQAIARELGKLRAGMRPYQQDLCPSRFLPDIREQVQL